MSSPESDEEHRGRLQHGGVAGLVARGVEPLQESLAPLIPTGAHQRLQTRKIQRRTSKTAPRAHPLSPRRVNGKWLQAVASQNFLHGGDHILLGDGNLRRTRGLPFLVGGDGGGRLRALDQVLDLHFAASRSSEPWMTTQGLLRRSAYFICAFMPAEPR